MAVTHPGESPEYRAARDRLLEPSWNMFDLTPEGRDPAWDEQLRYD
jgi:predicted dithiol-disulfide oxidoreductase (DUF899 family)